MNILVVNNPQSLLIPYCVNCKFDKVIIEVNDFNRNYILDDEILMFINDNISNNVFIYEAMNFFDLNKISSWSKKIFNYIKFKTKVNSDFSFCHTNDTVFCVRNSLFTLLVAKRINCFAEGTGDYIKSNWQIFIDKIKLKIFNVKTRIDFISLYPMRGYRNKKICENKVRQARFDNEHKNLFDMRNLLLPHGYFKDIYERDKLPKSLVVKLHYLDDPKRFSTYSLLKSYLPIELFILKFNLDSIYLIESSCQYNLMHVEGVKFFKVLSESKVSIILPYYKKTLRLINEDKNK